VIAVRGKPLSAYSVEVVTGWAGDPACLRGPEERNVSSALAGDELTVPGRVAALEPAPGAGWCGAG
jgi:hypothetical protein